MTKIKAVLFDMIGTTVKTSSPDLIIDCFKKAFTAYNIQADEEVLRNSRGKNKMTMIREVLDYNRLPVEMADLVFHSFTHMVNNSLTSFTEMNALPEVFSFLQQKYIRIGIGSGLPKDLFVAVFNHLGWDKYSFDYIGIAELLGKSRPDPAMIFDMMQLLKITNPEEVLKIGDTIADIREGKNAGVKTAVILSGTQEETLLKKENPDYVVSSLEELLDLPIWS